MFYYKKKNGTSFLVLKHKLTTENYPEYSQAMVNKYEEITKQQFEALQPKFDEE